MNVYWYKAIRSTAAIVNGRKYDGWEHLDGNRGVKVLDSEKDAELITGLQALHARRQGGVIPISEERYNELKKKAPWKPPAPKSWHDEPLKINGKKTNLPKPKQAVVPPVAKIGELPTPKTDEIPQRPNDQPDFRTNPDLFKPTTKKLSSLGI